MVTASSDFSNTYDYTLELTADSNLEKMDAFRLNLPDTAVSSQVGNKA